MQPPSHHVEQSVMRKRLVRGHLTLQLQDAVMYRMLYIHDAHTSARVERALRGLPGALLSSKDARTNTHRTRYMEWGLNMP